MPSFHPPVYMMAGLGVILGIIGFTPLYVVVRMACRGRVRPSVAKGLAAVGVSFAFLMAVEAATWVFAPIECLSVLTGMLVGFFGMWAYMAYMALRRRL